MMKLKPTNLEDTFILKVADKSNQVVEEKRKCSLQAEDNHGCRLTPTNPSQVRMSLAQVESVILSLYFLGYLELPEELLLNKDIINEKTSFHSKN